jgi:tRNA (cytosine38-C5)-methyltransferase
MYRVLEFYSGIGGMHCALKRSEIDAAVIGALEINTTANSVYSFNYESPVYNVNLDKVTASFLDKFNADIYLMSPPCQPYTRTGKQEHSKDARSRSFLNIISKLKEMTRLPTYILVENVKGFEISDTNEFLVKNLKELNYKIQQYLLSPLQFGIPNSRLRYYLIASRNGQSSFIDSGNMILTEFPFCKTVEKANLKSYLELVDDADHIFLEDKILWKYGAIIDIVSETSERCLCFTKGYCRKVEGSGSFIQTKGNLENSFKIYEEMKNSSKNDDDICPLKNLGLRYCINLVSF